MNLESRKNKILASIIKNYIATGEPVGSKSLLDYLDFAVSSATVRNEMADLADMGFIVQPHTSAGRIPSQKGYRYFLDYLMDPQAVGTEERQIIDNALKLAADDPEHILSEASKILAELTGYVAISTTPPSGNTKIERIRMVQTGRHTSMMVMITSTGMVKNRLFRCGVNINTEMLSVFEKALNEMLKGVSLSAITPSFMKTVALALGEISLIAPDIFRAVVDAAKEASMVNITLNGKTNLLLVQDFDLASVRGIMKFLDNREDIEQLLFKTNSQIAVMLGTEINVPEIAKTSIAVSRYYIEDRPAGLIAVVGPMRMDYGKTLANLEYVSCVTGKLITELLQEN